MPSPTWNEVNSALGAGSRHAQNLTEIGERQRSRSWIPATKPFFARSAADRDGQIDRVRWSLFSLIGHEPVPATPEHAIPALR